MIEATSKSSTQHQSQMPSEMVQTVVGYVLEEFHKKITLDNLAEVVKMSRFNFCRRFQKESGVTPMRWVWTFRTLLAAEMIKNAPHWSLTDVAFACGFTSSAHFSRTFKQIIKENPSLFRKKIRGAMAAQKRGRPQALCDPLLQDNNELKQLIAELSLRGP